MRVNLNKRPSCFFLFELLNFIVKSASASGEREGGSNLEEKKGYDCLPVRTRVVEQYEARREHISSLALGGGGRGLVPLFSPFMKNLSGEKRNAKEQLLSYVTPLFSRLLGRYARIAGFCFSVVVVVGMICMK